MVGKITAEILNTYSVEQLKAYINRTAKKSNLDLRALEAAGAAKGSSAYRYIKTKAFDAKQSGKFKKEDATIGINKKGEFYFKTNFTGKESRAELLHRASIIANFKGAKTHTVSGVERAYDKSYQTYINRKSRRLAEEKYGIGKATKAQILKEKIALQTDEKKAAFNEAWASLNKEQYKQASRMSEQVAELFLRGYTASEVMEAIDKIGEEYSVQEYIDYLGEPNTESYMPQEEEEQPPFMED